MAAVIITCNIISAVCLWALLCAIVINFYLASKNNIKKEKKSVVETGSMLSFFLLMVVLVAKRIGALNLTQNIMIVLAIVGTVIIIIATIINIVGRLYLRGNWGNQIRIYNNHTLVTSDIYKYIRHPLYSSTIAMLYGFSLLFANPLVFALNTLIFLPFMIYRAKQEDKLLLEAFGDKFSEYKSRVGMLFFKGVSK